MFSSFIWIYIIPMILISPLMSISMNSWFSIWMTLEINLMSFIPLIIFFNKFYKELSLKYYIIQSMSSSTLIFSSNLLMINMNNYYMNNLIHLMSLMMNLSILIKLGAAPFHYWFINMMNNMIWLNCFILSTWQKIIPMIMMMYSFNKFMIYPSIILSSITGAMLGMNHQSLRLIMSYSSINHISWMLLNLMISEMMLILYFISYSIMNFSIMFMFNNYNMFFINQINLINLKINKLLMLMNFISISGLPPMFGFMMKWFSLFIMNNNFNYFMIIILIMMSLLTFTFYMKLCISFMIIYKIETKMNMINKMMLPLKLNYIKFMLLINLFNLWLMNNWII